MSAIEAISTNLPNGLGQQWAGPIAIPSMSAERTPETTNHRPKE